MNAPSKFEPRWASDMTRDAYLLLERLARRVNEESDAASLLHEAMEAIERADCHLDPAECA